MNVAFFTDTYLPNVDGVTTAIVNFRTELERRGHAVYVFAAGDAHAKKCNRDPHVFYYASTPFRPYPAYKIALFPFLAKREIEHLDIDIVHSHGMASMGLAAARAAHTLGLPLVGSFHTLVADATHYISDRRIAKALTKRIAWRYLEWYYNYCDATLAPSASVKALLEQHGIKRVRIVPNGIDTQRFSPGDAHALRAKLGGSVVLHVGRLVLEKNLELLINAAKRVVREMPGCRFVVLSDGPARERYLRRVEALRLREHFVFTGEVSAGELLAFYRCADVLAIPSKFETQGLVVLEAMACGTPVAGADYGAIPDFVKDGYNGYLFDANSASECAETIIKALHNKSSAMRRNARKTAERYSVQRCTDALLAAYGEAALEHERRGSAGMGQRIFGRIQRMRRALGSGR
jgi:1,2-diacylglycerol 3-alpha-glucosyltransferase